MAKQAHLQAIISAVDRLSPTLAKIGVNTARTKALMTTLNSVNFNKLRGSFRVINKSVTDVGSATSDVAGKLLPLLGLGALSFAGLGVGFLSSARGAMQFSAGMNDASEITGEAINKLQLLQGAFRLGGMEAEAANDAIVKFNKGMAEGAAGKDKGFAGLMTRLRIPMRDAKGQIRSLSDVIPELSDAFEKNVNPAVRTRMAMEFFGKSGAKLIGTLSQGGKSLKELFAELESSGRVLSTGAVGRLDKLDENLEELGVRYRVLSAEIMSRAAPAMQRLVERMQGWISANREVISQRLGAAIESAANAITSWINDKGIEKLTEQLRIGWGVLKDFTERLGGIGGVAKLAGVLLLAGPVASLVALGGAVTRLVIVGIPLLVSGLAALAGPLAATGVLALRLATTLGGVLLAGLQVAARAVLILGRALLLNPIGLAVTVIAGAAYLIWKNWETLGPMFKGLWDGIKGAMTTAWDSIIGVLRSAWDRIRPIIEPIINGISKAASIASSILPNFAAPPPAEGAVGFNGQRAPATPLAAARPEPTPLMRAGAMQGNRMDGRIQVDFANVPKGVRVTPAAGTASGISTSVGYDNATDVGIRGLGGIG